MLAVYAGQRGAWRVLPWADVLLPVPTADGLQSVGTERSGDDTSVSPLDHNEVEKRERTSTLFTSLSQPILPSSSATITTSFDPQYIYWRMTRYNAGSGRVRRVVWVGVVREGTNCARALKRWAAGEWVDVGGGVKGEERNRCQEHESRRSALSVLEQRRSRWVQRSGRTVRSRKSCDCGARKS
jgi:hypothetical protein